MAREQVPEHLQFDTEVFPADERVERYRAIYGLGAEIAATGPAPRATFRGWHLDRAILYDRKLNDIAHRRAARDLDSYNLTHWTVTLVLEGSMSFDLGAAVGRITPGELLLVDTNAPLRNEAQGAHIATLSIARDQLEAMVGSLEGLHGLIIAADHAQLYAATIRSLLAALPTMASRAVSSITAALGHLLKAALDMQGKPARKTSRNPGNERIQRLRVLVEERLSDVNFGIDALMAETGLSRATLYRLMRPLGSFSKFVQLRRLENLRRSLSDPQEQRPFAALALAAGFRDEAAANRAFLARFAVRPGAYRATILQNQPNDQFRTWQEELR